MFTPADGDPNVGLSPDEFAQAFAQLHVELGIELPDALT